MVAFRGSGPGHSVEPTSKTRSVACLLFCLRTQFGRTTPNLSRYAQFSRSAFNAPPQAMTWSNISLHDFEVGVGRLLRDFANPFSHRLALATGPRASDGDDDSRCLHSLVDGSCFPILHFTPRSLHRRAGSRR